MLNKDYAKKNPTGQPITHITENFMKESASYTPKLTIVIPVYNEELTIKNNIQAIKTQIKEDYIDSSIILVDDGSKDNTWLTLVDIVNCIPDVVAIKLSRNFGKEAAIFAGISQVDTELCLVMDSDLQHPPKYIKQFLEKMEHTGADIIEGIKTNRGQESIGYKFFAKTFYNLLNIATGVNLDNSSDFKLFNRKVMDTLSQFNEDRVFFRGIINYCGFTKEEISFIVEDRKGDTSKFSKRKLFSFAINSMLSYTGKPIYITFVASFLFAILAVVLGVSTLYNYFTGHAETGFSTVILLLLIIGALILFSIGLIGAYISRIYDEVKCRPRHIISQRIDTQQRR